MTTNNLYLSMAKLAICYKVSNNSTIKIKILTILVILTYNLLRKHINKPLFDNFDVYGCKYNANT